MKVCIVIDHWFPTIGGGPEHVRQIVNHIVDPNIEIEVVTSRLKTYDVDVPSKPYFKGRLKTLPPKGSYFSLINRLKFTYSLTKYLFQAEFDILHVHPFLPLLVAKTVAVIRRKPILATLHSSGKDAVGFRRSFVPLLIFLIHVLTSKLRYNALIFVSRSYMRNLLTVSRKIYIPNGVKVVAKFRKPKSKIFTFLYVGRFHPQKNLEALITAFYHTFRYSNNLCKLILIGAGPEEKKLKGLITRLGISTEVKLLPPVRGTKLAEFYRHATAFVLPSLYEGLPLTLLEAWAFRLPVGATPVGDNNLLIKDNYNGMLSQGTSVSELAKLLYRLYSAKNLNKMGERGFKFVAREFSWQQAADSTMRLYKDIGRKHFASKSLL